MKSYGKWILAGTGVFLAVFLVSLPILGGFAPGTENPWFGGGMMGGGYSMMGGGYPMMGFGALIMAGLVAVPILLVGIVVAGLFLLAGNSRGGTESAAGGAKCPRCGSAVEHGWVACPHCGEKI